MNIARAVEAATEQMTGGEIIGMFAIGFFIFGSIIAVIIWVGIQAMRGDERAKAALQRSSQTMSKQMKGYVKNFKDGYDDGRNRLLGALLLAIPAKTATEMEDGFSDGLGQVLTGVWRIAAPYVSVGVVLFIIIVIAKKFAGRQR